MTETYENTLAYARQRDADDPLARFRERFHLPQHNGQPSIYFCGNSLGLQPKAVTAALRYELDVWANLAVDGHFHGEQPWYHYHEYLAEPTARLVGAQPDEVIVMNTLSVNLHLLLASFYRPTDGRFKILVENDAFPSDHYVLESQVRWHGYDPAEAIVEMQPRPGEHTLRTEDIEAKIAEMGGTLALVMFGGVNYYTGQFFDLGRITAAAHEVGAVAGYDLAHAAGNVPLRLHDWNVDFAAWCSYKYLNSGPGGVSGAFVNARYGRDFDGPRLAGWWGHDEAARFQMEKGFKPMPGAAGWQLSNGPVLLMAAHLASLRLFDEAGGMAALSEKSHQLTGYLETLLREVAGLAPGDSSLEIITPTDPAQRGCQLSLLVRPHGRQLFEALLAEGVVGDWREPDVIRVAPAPLYNTFEEVYRFAELVRQHLSG